MATNACNHTVRRVADHVRMPCFPLAAPRSGASAVELGALVVHLPLASAHVIVASAFMRRLHWSPGLGTVLGTSWSPAGCLHGSIVGSTVGAGSPAVHRSLSYHRAHANLAAGVSCCREQSQFPAQPKDKRHR